jgi:hypothetical protein
MLFHAERSQPTSTPPRTLPGPADPAAAQCRPRRYRATLRRVKRSRRPITKVAGYANELVPGQARELGKDQQRESEEGLHFSTGRRAILSEDQGLGPGACTGSPEGSNSRMPGPGKHTGGRALRSFLSSCGGIL